VKVTSCLLLTEAVKQPGLACHHAALRVGEFEVATSGGIWVAIRGDFVLTVRLSVVQGLALRLGLSNDSPNELNPDFGFCDGDRYPKGTRQAGQLAGLS